MNRSSSTKFLSLIKKSPNKKIRSNFLPKINEKRIPNYKSGLIGNPIKVRKSKIKEKLFPIEEIKINATTTKGTSKNNLLE